MSQRPIGSRNEGRQPAEEPVGEGAHAGVAKRRGRGALVGAILLLAAAIGGGGIAAWRWLPGPDEEGQGEAAATPGQAAAGDAKRKKTAADRWEALVRESPYRNVQAGVRYVKDASCAECHAEIAVEYAKHPMGMSLAPVAEASRIERFEAGGAGGAGFEEAGLKYAVREEGKRQFHTETRLSPEGKEALTSTWEAEFVVGSGRTGRSYLVGREGRLFMSPITWYADHGWDLSPGYETNNSHFNRPVSPECLFCHANQALHVAGTLNRYERLAFEGHAIGCQRCHGPGEAHVAARKGGERLEGGDLTIVNPARLAPSLRESVCQQCHLGGLVRVEARGRRREDFRPGLPWSTVEAVLLPREEGEGSEAGQEGAKRGGEGERFVGQVEQMHRSACYTGSKGKLGCISCHDSHRLPKEEEKAAYYRQRCLECHATAGCSVPEEERRARQGDDSCMVCHMPRGDTQIPHAAVTDHAIPRTPGERRKGRMAGGGPEWSPLVAFDSLVWPDEGTAMALRAKGGDKEGAENEAVRDLAIGWMRGVEKQPGLAAESDLPAVFSTLGQAVRRDPKDFGAQQALLFGLLKLGEMQMALEQADLVLALSPNDETTIVAAAALRMGTGDWMTAAKLWERAREINPWMARYWAEMALCQARGGRGAEATATCEEGLKRFPDSFAMRQMLIESRLAARRIAEAEQEFARMRELNPPRVEGLQRWWEKARARAGGGSEP